VVDATNTFTGRAFHQKTVRGKKDQIVVYVKVSWDII